MISQFFKKQYPEGIDTEIDLSAYSSVLDVLDESCKHFADRPAFSNMGKTISFKELDQHARDFAAYLQNHLGLKAGERIAIQLPNTLQYPIALFGAMRAGLIVVNTNPLYTEREMRHQFQDSGVKALVVLANMAHLAEKVLPDTKIEHVIVTELGDMQGFAKRLLINAVVRYVKKMVPAFSLPKAVTFRSALSIGQTLPLQEHRAQPEDLAVLQYTGGTTGVAKGAMLSHRNLVANMLQARIVIKTVMDEGTESIVLPLPMYHIYSFTVSLVLMELGNHSILITNPRDLPAFVKELSKTRFTGFVGLNTLFVALANRDDFKQLDFSGLKLTISGGMALTHAAEKEWHEVTGCHIYEGYGMTETSPIATFNLPCKSQLGTIGFPVPSTDVKVVDEQGVTLPLGEVGELCVQGPQVMVGYWNKPEETAEMIDEQGWLNTGDMAVIQPDGYIRIVDRKKDMINVSGFNVYPNEVEDVIVSHPAIIEAAAIGVPDEKTGEAIKVFLVLRNHEISAQEVKDYCREHLTGYKVPKQIEFRKELPKTNVGKVLRRTLRDEELAKIKQEKVATV
ncbi:long-chain acyl-CoA synthetase [Oceanospirillum multiglobuliferum]|uniref:Long-chain-fatty-acid--CoA ligase n=1 Tax=Oceanospirillum multiglobuliferum TaxID=64969 RepID=A0A1T4KDR5_9GAMM|nr:AMP-binding protein [Oceanospirillum multiglobuliferum]OPX56003.1 long-chain fatty acid--CoA ligase [Oceanospirillum multiglobuliferum]SJZ40495.1 long-chain acyl-CoA synthetase [Oceanospirillum multiglobuliferum]